MSKTINIIFPHQLFEENPLLKNNADVYLIEEFLFFKQYKFHKQKIAYHRSSMKFYQKFLEKKGVNIVYINTENELSDIRNFGIEIEKKSIEKICIIDPTDDWLENRIKESAKNIELEILENPQFLNSKKDLSEFFKTNKKSYHQTTFYKQQRLKRNILINNGEPLGGDWTYDKDNRKKYPKSKTPPPIHYPNTDLYWEEALEYTQKYFENNPGKLSKEKLYPNNHIEAKAWLSQFLNFRFFDFGAYEDAIVKKHTILNHSVLTPLLNSGLLLPDYIVNLTLEFAEQENIPINSTEGFIRQIIGWREFMRGMYQCKGRFSRSQNFWGFKRKMPNSFYEGNTGIAPLDDSIRKIHDGAYCHHIERLMVLGNFMLLCEIHPDEVYRWFMELFIDAYDWVMVPNIYGMSQFADGGTFATKPYISGSNYINKMSDYGKGEWQDIWDALFWNFIYKQQSFFKKNPRTAMMVNTYNKMSQDKKEKMKSDAETFINNGFRL